MSKLNRKLLALLLAVMMLLSLAACGDKDREELPAETPAAQAQPGPGEGQPSLSGPADAENFKNLTISIIFADGSQKDLKISTKAETLREALEPDGIIQGEESEYGLFVKTVGGQTADDSKQQWWAITKGGQMCETGVDGIMISDGESYEFTLTTGY